MRTDRHRLRSALWTSVGIGMHCYTSMRLYTHSRLMNGHRLSLYRHAVPRWKPHRMGRFVSFCNCDPGETKPPQLSMNAGACRIKGELGASLSHLKERISIVVTTSPIPSHPSPALLRALFASFRKHLHGIDGECERIVVCDGYERIGPKSQLCSADAYASFLGHVQSLVEAGEFGRACQMMSLDTCKGYGLGLTAALESVRTEYVLVVQHDWLFVHDVNISTLLAAMDEDEDVKYIGMQSMTTLDYAKHIRLRHGLELPPSRVAASGIKLVPQLLWYDKPHICRARQYREEVLRRVPMGICECPERKYGVELMWPELRSSLDLQAAHKRYGTFYWDAGAEVVYHLSGRKVRAAAGAADLDAASLLGSPPPSLELRGEVRTSSTYTVAAADRTAHVPGLAIPAEKHSNAADAPRFKGRCYICGEKGHSKLCCPRRSSSQSSEVGASLAVAGC